MFGGGQNPTDFVSVADVAAAGAHAVLDPDLRGQVIQLREPRNLASNQLAEQMHRARGRSANVRQIPWPVLRAVAPFSRRVAAPLARSPNAGAHKGSRGSRIR